MTDALRSFRTVALAALIGLASVQSADGQLLDPRVSEIPEAEALFQEAVAKFEAGDYADAAGQFSRVANAWGLHTKTTAAAFMEARALYRVGSFERAIAAFDSFLETYGSSRYVSEAERSRRMAADALEATANAPVTIGVILSLSDDEASASQSLFNGFRLAVEAHNRVPGNRQVRMVFRDIGQLGADGAVASAVNEGATTIFGALFSDQARDAAAAAERLGAAFIAPMATDAAVTAGKQLAFQANPSIEMRGRLMARFAVNGLRLLDVGVIAENDDLGISGVMGRAFAEEAEALGARVRFVEILPNGRAWFNIDDHVPSDTLATVRGIYAPLSGSAADQLAGALLDGLRALLGNDNASRLRILGNAEWHDLPMRAEASLYSVTYSNDFFFDRTEPEAQAYIRRYRSLAGVAPGRLGVVGYDLAQYLLTNALSPNPDDVRNLLLGAQPYEGLGVRVYFGGEQVNRQMFYHRYRDGRLELVR